MKKQINSLTQSEYRRAKRLIKQGRLKSELETAGDPFSPELIDYEEFKAIPNRKGGRPKNKETHEIQNWNKR